MTKNVFTRSERGGLGKREEREENATIKPMALSLKSHKPIYMYVCVCVCDTTNA